jgi:hypothetical protein
MSVEEFLKNNLINLILILVKTFWTLTTKNQIYKTLD